MSNESENAITSAAEAPATNGKRKPAKKTKSAKKAKPAKKADRTKKTASKPQADRTNKKAEVIAMMKRAKVATYSAPDAAFAISGNGIRLFLIGLWGGVDVHESSCTLGKAGAAALN